MTLSIHIDATLHPASGLFEQPHRGHDDQRDIFEKMDGKLLMRRSQRYLAPLCYSSVWLSMNVLVIDTKTVCVEKSEVFQAEQMDKLGMEVVEVELRDAYAFGGGLHCCTADVCREGMLEDYFPNLPG